MSDLPVQPSRVLIVDDDRLNREKSTPGLRGFPVIMRTAAAATEKVVEGIEAGVFHCLTRPFGMAMLRSRVRSAVEPSRIRRPDVELAASRAFHVNGRGIALARKLSFRSLEYLGRGNQVLATLALRMAPVGAEPRMMEA